ncbi:MAG TPA: hypothetical protein VF875_09255 [Anaeromyxobacter sp.]
MFRSRVPALLVVALAVSSCKGSTTTETQIVHEGCVLPAANEAALHATLALSPPPNGTFFAVGEAPTLTLTVKDDCGLILAPSALETANLYVFGPRAPLATVAASKLMNAVTNRNAADRQHHFVNLRAPSYAVPANNGLVVATTGVVTYELRPVTTEAAGTYAAAVWLVSADGQLQAFPSASFQIGTGTVETYETGPDGSSSCRACHAGPTGRLYLAHGQPTALAPLGNPGLDSAPIGSCKACHNADGYSAVTTLQKVHGVHRGANLANPGGAHAEYGVAADATLASYTNVSFPSMPAGEKDCKACHVDDAWKTRPSRLACGTCHDAVFFDSGTVSPPRVYGRPLGLSCAADPDCVSFSVAAACNLETGSCELGTHPVQTNDATCAGCHTAEGAGLSPITDRHAIPERQNVPRLAIVNATVGGATGPSGTFLVGDVPTLTFQLQDWTGVLVTNAKTNSSYAIAGLVSGPTDDMQRVIAPALSKGSLAFDAGSQTYTFIFPSWPATNLAPYNASTGGGSPNPAGSYTLYFYVTRSFIVDGASHRDAAPYVGTLRFGETGPIRPREVVSQAACDACHVALAYHGGARTAAQACGTCHTAGALDRPLGAQGITCLTDAECPGYAAGWETCQGGPPGKCTITNDPTPETTIEYGSMTHAIHFARRRLNGYTARNDLQAPGRVHFVGYLNTLLDFSDALLSVDARECRTCHTSTGATCSTSDGCGIGQACDGGRCANVAWKAPSARVCLSCHASAATYGHAQLNTYVPGAGAVVETCDVCHGPGAAFSVEWAHDVAPASVTTYSREAFSFP